MERSPASPDAPPSATGAQPNPARSSTPFRIFATPIALIMLRMSEQPPNKRSWTEGSEWQCRSSVAAATQVAATAATHEPFIERSNTTGCNGPNTVIKISIEYAVPARTPPSATRLTRGGYEVSKIALKGRLS